MPKFFILWLRSLTPAQQDEMWAYFDGSYTVCEDVCGIVARECGCLNVLAPKHAPDCGRKARKVAWG